jgi:predicted nucleotidyltransferase
MVEKKEKKNSVKKENSEIETMKIVAERDIAFDFATKAYKKFDKAIKSIILFGSSAKRTALPDSDIDIIVIIDDISIGWDEELIAWYREELGKIIKENPYRKSLHINTVKLSSWWDDLMKGDPLLINIVRYGESLIDFGGFFSPLKILLQNGKIKSTPEAIYTLLQRAPTHLARTQAAMLSTIDGLYWASVDSAHAALIAAKIMPPSPEHIPEILDKEFVKNGMLKSKYVDFYIEIHALAKEIIHGKKVNVEGKKIDEYIKLTDEFIGEMARIIDGLIK